jgi:hypothetical protein
VKVAFHFSSGWNSKASPTHSLTGVAVPQVKNKGETGQVVCTPDTIERYVEICVMYMYRYKCI